jgi:hypothetical protein
MPQQRPDSPTTWHYTDRQEKVAGSVACGIYNGGPDITWTVNDGLLLGKAQGTTIEALHECGLATADPGAVPIPRSFKNVVDAVATSGSPGRPRPKEPRCPHHRLLQLTGLTLATGAVALACAGTRVRSPRRRYRLPGRAARRGHRLRIGRRGDRQRLPVCSELDAGVDYTDIGLEIMDTPASTPQARCSSSARWTTTARSTPIVRLSCNGSRRRGDVRGRSGARRFTMRALWITPVLLSAVLLARGPGRRR